MQHTFHPQPYRSLHDCLVKPYWPVIALITLAKFWQLCRCNGTVLIMKELAIAWLSMMVTVAVVGQGTADKTSADDPCIHTQDCKAFTGYSSRAPFVQASQGSPIMIPLDPGTDCTTQLTDPEHGITWDFNGNYHPVRIA